MCRGLLASHLQASCSVPHASSLHLQPCLTSSEHSLPHGPELSSHDTACMQVLLSRTVAAKHRQWCPQHLHCGTLTPRPMTGAGLALQLAGAHLACMQTSAPHVHAYAAQQRAAEQARMRPG